MLDFYARRSPIFMAARFDATRAAQLGQNTGDGTPIMVTIPTNEPWVPLRILASVSTPRRSCDADVFLLTDDRPKLLAGGRGLSLDRNEPANESLLTDLRTDKGMGWVPQHMWFTYPEARRARRRARLRPRGHRDQPDAVPSLTAAGVTAAGRGRVDLATGTHCGRCRRGLDRVVAFGPRSCAAAGAATGLAGMRSLRCGARSRSVSRS